MVSLKFGNRVTNYIGYVQNMEEKAEMQHIIFYGAHVHACSPSYTDKE